MKEKRFNDLYLDKQFSKYVKTILQSIYKQNIRTFQDNAIDFDDLQQECWASLYERVDDNKDKNYCCAAMKNAAIDLLRSMNTELRFVDHWDEELFID